MEPYVILICLMIWGGAFSSGMITVADKWNLIVKYQQFRARKSLNRWPDRCDFCLSFWINVMILIVLVGAGTIGYSFLYLGYPLAAAMMSDYFLR